MKTSVSELIGAFNDACKGRVYPHTTILNSAWKPILAAITHHFPDRYTAMDPPDRVWMFQGSIVQWDESEPNFRFEDIRAD